MRAMLLDAWAPAESSPLRAADIEPPTPGPGQVLIRVRACGVCRSNLHMIEGNWPGVPSRFPIIPGHEVVGEIAALGAGADEFEVGDRVGVQPLWSTCRRCEFCLSGRDQLCQAKEITGETVDGGYAELMLATAAHTYRLPDGLDYVAAASLFCPGITAYGSVLKAKLAPTQRVAVFGVGGVGHVVLQLARLYGGEVIAVARNPRHLGVAREVGADRVIDATVEDPGAVLAREGGVDAAIVFAPSDEVVRQAIVATKPGGRVVIGVNVDVGTLPFAQEKTVVGSLLGNRAQMREVLGLAAAGKLRIVHEAHPLADANLVLLRLKAGEIPARAVLVA